MNWRTKIGEIDIPVKINHKTNLLLLGSCFSDAMGKQFLDFKFSTHSNPFGIIFNPLSIAKLFSKEDYLDEHIVKSDQLYYHLDTHSAIKGETKEELKNKLFKMKSMFDLQVGKSDVIFITLGTGFVYEYLTTRKIIANCHKIPSQHFSKQLLHVEEIVRSFDEVLRNYPKKEFIFTVSPVRHTKEGLSHNMLSKSILRVACAELIKMTNVHYFPSYEMMVDDLRDYRFYKEDLIHISNQGEKYIWEKIKDTFFCEATLQLIGKIEKIKRRIAHRPFNPNTEIHLTFLEETLKGLNEMTHKVDVQYEIEIIHEQIRAITLAMDSDDEK